MERNLAKAWLSDPKKLITVGDKYTYDEANWLVIFDNVDDSEVLEDYWPIFSSGAILITSRDPLTRTMLSQTALNIDLKSFEDEEGASYLRKMTSNTEDVGLAVQISNQFGGLPLALSQMAGIILEEMMNFREFLSRYSEIKERPEMYGFEPSGRNKTRRGSVAFIFATDKLKSQGAKRLLEISSFLDPDCVHGFVLEHAVGMRSIEDFPQTKSAFYKARAELLRASLFQRSFPEEQDSSTPQLVHATVKGQEDFSIHRLVQDTVKANLTDGRILTTVKDALSILKAVWGPTALDKRHSVELWRKKHAIYRHVLAVKSFIDKWDGTTDRELDISLAQLLSETGWWLHERGNSRDCLVFLEAGLDLIERHEPGIEGGMNDEALVVDLLSDIHYGLGAQANESNKAALCLHHCEVFLNLRLASGKQDLRLAIAYNQIAVAWLMTKDVNKACPSFEQSIQTYRNLGASYWKCMESLPMVNLGQALWLAKDYPGALSILLEGLKMREEVFGVMDKNSFR